jgi:predicted dehydrogenase
MIKVAIIGFGYWGPNMVRNFYAQPNCEVKLVADQREERLKIVKNNYPIIKTTTSTEDVFSDLDIDAVVIATPVFTHYELAKKAIKSGKHVLIEKPMTASVAEAEELIDLAAQYKKVVMVDHTFLYTGAVQKIKAIVEENKIGNIQYIDSTRINLGIFQPDINVLWDLATHDISIVNHIINEKPVSVQATGISHTNNDIENIAFLTLNYQNNLITHFNCSWTSPLKIRKFLIGGDKKMIVWDDMEPTEKIKVYDTGYDIRNDEDKQQILIDYRVGDIYVPKVPQKEALAGVAEDFLSAIDKNTTPISDYKSGINVVKVLEASDQSIKNNGKEIEINFL